MGRWVDNLHFESNLCNVEDAIIVETLALLQMLLSKVQIQLRTKN